jgi:hypothetical protein
MIEKPPINLRASLSPRHRVSLILYTIPRSPSDSPVPQSPAETLRERDGDRQDGGWSDLFPLSTR